MTLWKWHFISGAIISKDLKPSAINFWNPEQNGIRNIDILRAEVENISSQETNVTTESMSEGGLQIMDIGDMEN